MLEFEKLIEKVSESIRKNGEKELSELSKTYNTPVATLIASAWVTSNCADIIFINLTPLGTANGTMQVNNYTLQPGGYLGITGNNAEINKQSYNVVFAAGATTCVVIKRLYQNP